MTIKPTNKIPVNTDHSSNPPLFKGGLAKFSLKGGMAKRGGDPFWPKKREGLAFSKGGGVGNKGGGHSHLGTMVGDPANYENYTSRIKVVHP